MVDIVGKILTPLLLLGLLTMILSGIINPIGPIPSEPLIDNVAETGIKCRLSDSGRPGLHDFRNHSPKQRGKQRIYPI